MGGVILELGILIIPQIVSGKLPTDNIYFGGIRNWEGGTEESAHPVVTLLGNSIRRVVLNEKPDG